MDHNVRTRSAGRNPKEPFSRESQRQCEALPTSNPEPANWGLEFRILADNPPFLSTFGAGEASRGSQLVPRLDAASCQARGQKPCSKEEARAQKKNMRVTRVAVTTAARVVVSETIRMILTKEVILRTLETIIVIKARGNPNGSKNHTTNTTTTTFTLRFLPSLICKEAAKIRRHQPQAPGFVQYHMCRSSGDS